jgi:radical SAM protein with 4Fe4S-binding SPASM domain
VGDYQCGVRLVELSQKMKSLEITVRVGCPVDCGFCPQSTIKAAYAGNRDFDLTDFRKIINKIPCDCRLDFSGFTEPLIHPDTGQMIREASAISLQVHLYTTLVGLTLDKLKSIKESNIQHIRIHVPDQKAMIVPDDRWIALHATFRGANIHATYMSMGAMTPKVEEYMKSLGIQVDMPTMLSRGGNLWDVKKHTGHIVCSMDRWHSNVVLPNGDVYGDCMDYGLTVRLGNLLSQPYSEIYEAAECWKNSPKAEDSICTKCEWNAGNKA